MSQIISGPNITKPVSLQEKLLLFLQTVIPFWSAVTLEGVCLLKPNPEPRTVLSAAGLTATELWGQTLTRFLHSREPCVSGTQLMFHFSSPSPAKVKKTAKAAETPSKVCLLERMDTFALSHWYWINNISLGFLEEARGERKRKWRGGC